MNIDKSYFVTFGLFLSFAVVFATQRCFGAQDGQVTANSASILSSPSDSGDVIGTVNQGQVVRMSDNAKGGFYRAAVPGTNQIGWISERDVAPGGAGGGSNGQPKMPRPPAPSNSRMSRISDAGGDSNDRNYRRGKSGGTTKVYILAEGQMHYVQALDTGTSTAGASSFFTPVMGAEIGLRVDPKASIGIQYLKHSFVRTDATAFSAKGSMIGLNGVYQFNDDPKLRFYGNLALGGSMGTVVTAALQGKTYASASFMAIYALLGGGVRMYVSPNFGIDLTAGYRILSKSAVALTSSTAIDVNLSSPYIGGGIVLEF